MFRSRIRLAEGRAEGLVEIGSNLSLSECWVRGCLVCFGPESGWPRVELLVLCDMWLTCMFRPQNK